MDTIATPSVATTRLRRIAGMSLAEIRYRGRQAGSKLIDRLRQEADARDPRALLQREAPLFADPRAAVASLRHTLDQRFFAGANAETAHRLGAGEANRVIGEADRLIAGHFDLLGYRDLSFGDPIDWHVDPVWRRRSPLTHWSRIHALDPAAVGDSKVVWELNRHQWMVRLAQAALITGDPSFGACAINRMLEWINANPAGRGINWASSLEVALRLMSWTWTLALLRDANLLTETAATTVLASVHAHASHVQRFLSCYYSPNTHLTGEALGLFYAGCLYPQFEDSRQWRNTATATLIAEAHHQITADGVYFEQSTCYQRYTADIYLHFLLLAERIGLGVPQQVRERVTHLVEFLAAVSGPDGSMPNVGDADGGWLMPLSRRDADDCRGTLAVAAGVFNRSDLAVGDAPESLWLTGAPAMPRSSKPIRRRSQLFAEGGYAVLRSGEHQLIVDVGPLGCFAHGHADLLSVQCRIFGEACLVDSGTYGYTAEPEWRDYFRGSAAHSTVTVDGHGQAAQQGPFGWQSRPAVTVHDWRSEEGFDLIDAGHDAYPGVTHRRSVVAANGHFVIIDDLLGNGLHQFELTWQFAPMTVEITSDIVARATTPAGHHLWVMPVSSAPLHAEVVTGRTNPIRGWVSPEYGQKIPAPALVYSSRSALPVRIVTVLYPQF